ncbi:MAG: septation protein IspZ [Halieaceae bacterium]|nr:septation protein IspZ [Halieaceae bacterium]
MKQILEFLPIMLFFGAYQMDGETLTVGAWSHTFDGIFSATAVLMIATIAVWLIMLAITRRNDKRLMWMMVAVVVFGTATLVLRDQRFIQWKPTVFNWVMAVLFFGSQFVGEKTLLERFAGQQLVLSAVIWKRLNALWVTNFVTVGALNLYVAYQYEEAFWVSYKLYSSIGFILLMMLLTVMIVAPHLRSEDQDIDPTRDSS